MTQPGPHLTARLSIKVTPDQFRRWRRTARADGRDLSNWVRWVLDQACGRVEPVTAEQEEERR